MEYSVIQLDLNSPEIKPSQALKNYSNLVAKNNEAWVSGKKLKVRASCVSCGSTKLEAGFKKIGLEYSRCGECRTLFVKDSPSQKDLEDYFLNSEARKFWWSEIGSKTQDARRTKLIRPLLDWAENHLEERFGSKEAKTLLYFPTSSLFYKEAKSHPKFQKGKIYSPIFAKNDEVPAPSDFAALSEKGSFHAVLLLQSLGSTENPAAVLEEAKSILTPGGLVFLTPLLSTGLDIEAAGEFLPGIIPPDHLNLFSFEGLQSLAKRSGFETIEFSTPGALDTKNLEWIANDPSLKDRLPSFLSYWLKNRPGEELQKDLQEFLQRYRLSSLGRVVLSK